MLLDSIKQSLNQIITSLEQIHKQSTLKQQYLYCELNIGKHVRHINDHFLAVKQGLVTGIIDYNGRNRGTDIETNSDIALQQIHDLISWIDTDIGKFNEKEINKQIKIFSEIDCQETQSMEFSSTIAREFLYLINHTIHHAAHIALIAKYHDVEIPLNTGMAPCTMTYLRATNS
jgi:hypothetical protein